MNSNQNIFIFTAGDSAARGHLADSIFNPIDQSRILDFFDLDDQLSVNQINSEHGLYAWGAVPGVQNNPRWGQIKAGDWMLCVFDATYQYVSQVIAKFENEKFAKEVWGETDEGKTWQLMYFLTRPVAISIKISDLSDFLSKGYKGFSKISEEKVSLIEKAFGSVQNFIESRLLAEASLSPIDAHPLEKITKEDVIQAIELIDSGQMFGFAPSSDYDLLYQEKRYPPKAAVGIATIRTLGRAMRPDEFSSGVGSKNFRVLKALGFEIVEKNYSVNFWIEKSEVKGRSDRESGPNSLGVALWSPQKSRGERKADIYANMRRVNPGDIVFHLVDNKSIVGISVALNKFDDSFTCLEGTNWAGDPGYRIQLSSFIKLENEITREEIFSYRSELLDIRESNSNLFYTKGMTLTEGGYLTSAPIELVSIFNRIYFQKTGSDLPLLDKSLLDKLPISESLMIYSIEDAVSELLISREDFEEMLESLHSKKNLILQGPPGTGKSFVAKKLAYALLDFKDDSRIESVQFHQSFSYEDFIQGFRPKKDGSGFMLKDGVFFRFCKKALLDPTRPYVFIIDEINRGNLSKIFGEVMLLIETDKRGPEWAVSLTYSDESASKFHIPANVHILGMMNTADRSLAIVDYALRRRFAFKDVMPGFDSDKFGPLLESKGVEQIVISAIQNKMAALNKEIESSVDLGRGFTIGHSFFVPFQNVTDSKIWYDRVIKNEIIPLLREYWFDKKQSEVDQHVQSLNL